MFKSMNNLLTKQVFFSTLLGPTNRVTADEEVLTIYGVIGFIRLLAGTSIDRSKAGLLCSCCCYNLALKAN